MTAEPFSQYQKRLFLFLSVATFFEGYDFLALTQILPNLRASMHLDETAAGFLVGFINLGTVLAYFLVRAADRWGRSRLLKVTILGYTLFTFLSGLSPNVWAFGFLQMTARIFLLSEWAISMVIAAEEFAAARRGMVIGVISAFGSLGSVVCAGVVPLLLKLPWGWRSVYFVGIIPLVLLSYARRNLKETRRFEESGRAGERRPLTFIWKTPYRKRMLELAAIWFFTYVCTQNAITFWKEFAVHERGMSDGQVGASITIAALAAMPLVFLSGKLLDLVGRRIGACFIYTLTALGVFLSYTLHVRWGLTLALTFGIFGASAVLPVLNAYTTELFTTDLRGDAFAWSNNLIGRIGYVTAPVAVGWFAHSIGWSHAVRSVALSAVLALGLILWLLPETRAKELEETSAL